MDEMESIIKKEVEKRIDKEIDQIISDEIQEMYYRLTDMKEKYIAEIMSGIKFYHSQTPGAMEMNYKIVFENVTRIEDRK